MKIKEIIVVEGKHDSAVLKQYFDCDTIETCGSAINQDIMNQIKIAQAKRGVIIFTDPDYPGEKIRNQINSEIDGCLNAYIAKNKAKTTKKVGIEHASKQDLYDALQHLFTYQKEYQETLSKSEFRSLGLEGNADSSKKRAKIAMALSLGKPNAKTLFKRINMLQMTYDELVKILKEDL